MTLAEQLLTNEQRPRVVADCVRLIESEVASKSGFSGLAIKGGFKVARRLDKGNLVPRAVNDLLPEFIEAMEPFYAEFVADGSGDFAAFCRGREDAMANALLAVTDGKARHARNQVLKGVYSKLRPSAVRNITAALPGLAKIVAKHATAPQ
jgi:hypothetical protein